MDAVTLIGGAASAMLSGRFLGRRPGVIHRSGLTELEVTSVRPFPWQVDGDYVGMTNRLEFAYEPDVLDLVVPCFLVTLASSGSMTRDGSKRRRSLASLAA